MYVLKYGSKVGLSKLLVAVVNLIRRQLGWVALGLLLTVVWSFQPAYAHRPHDVVTQIKLSPNYSQDQTAYTIVRGNLLKSVDQGERWKRLVQGLDTLAPLSTLTIDQTEGQLLALGTHGDGIFLSDDQGESWRQSNQGLDTLDIGLIYSLPSNSQVLLAAGAEGGVFQSVDRGQTWNSVVDASQLLLTLNEVSGTVWGGDDRGQLLRSNDSGQSWQRVLTVADDPISTIAANDNVLYVGTDSKGVYRVDPTTLEIIDINQGLEDLRIQDVKILPGDSRGVILSSWDRGISISLDTGETWTDYPNGLIKDKQADEFETHHFSEIAVSDNFVEDETVFLGGFNGLYKSNQGGQRWREISTLDEGVVAAMDVSPNYAEDGTLALTTYVGKIMTSNDQGKTWELTMNGVEVPRLNGSFKQTYQDPRRFFDIAFSPDYGTDKTLFTTGLWTKFVRSTNGARSWSVHSLSKEARGLTLLLSPEFSTDKTMYVSNQAGLLFRSTNGGRTLEEIANLPWERGNDSPSMAISPSFTEDRTLYTVAETGVYRSTDAGETWQATTAATPIAAAGNLHIEISPNYPQDKTLFVSSYDGLFKTTDSGESWQSVAIADVAPERTFLEGVAVSPNYGQDGTVMVSLRGKGLYRSVDGGDSFTPIGDASLAFSRMYNVPCAGRPIQFSPNYAEDNTIFGFGTAHTDVYRSTDGGETWETLTTPDIEPPTELSTLTTVAIAAELYRGRILKTLLAVGVAIVAYFVVGLLPLRKIIKLNRRLLQFGTAMASFAVALVVLLKI
ncbi:glycosyl bnr repeat-containing protein [Leptolyngbya sp. Heron Island J]|uniref:sialidase family protein n=1 Tax=Leptolyngbya sp. Heron Island J TaxID=1385935 RepID=UPI0003B94FEE|nr:YCF48-related protein [Leptolyngbya sp. Heron Island J]ESA32502.1 glycosyl bnr repeat-containing protein [Leptolyngbya sp. Heron Island J]